MTSLLFSKHQVSISQNCILEGKRPSRWVLQEWDTLSGKGKGQPRGLWLWPRAASGTAQFPAALPAGKAPAGPSSSSCWDVHSHRPELFAAPLAIPLPSGLQGDQVDPLKHLLPKDSFMAVPQAALLLRYYFC